MAIKTFDQYVEDLRNLNLEVYFMGEKIENPVDHPAIRPHINAAGMTYRFANDPEFEDLATATSHLTGKTINRFTHIDRKSVV